MSVQTTLTFEAGRGNCLLSEALNENTHQKGAPGWERGWGYGPQLPNHLLHVAREPDIGFHLAPTPRGPFLGLPTPTESEAQEFICLLLLVLLNIHEMQNGTVT